MKNSVCKTIGINILVTLILIGGLELLARWIYPKINAGKSFNEQAENIENDYYKKAAWADEYWQHESNSFNFNFASYVTFRRQPYHSRYVNIMEEGYRRTTDVSTDEKAKKIFFLGGSTMFGFGSPDSLTIPSFFAKKWREKMPADSLAQVVNFGESAWVCNQGVAWLIKELQRGNIPDEVIFYDGANDVYSMIQNGGKAGEICNLDYFNRKFQSGAKPLIMAVFDKIYLYKTIVALTQKKETGPFKLPEGSVEKTVENYLSAYKVVEALSLQYGFDFYFFWQPVIYTKKSMGGFEKSYSANQPVYFGDLAREVTGMVNKQEISTAYTRLFDISDCLDKAPEDLYFDHCHLVPPGNEMVAGVIFDIISENKKGVLSEHN